VAHGCLDRFGAWQFRLNRNLVASSEAAIVGSRYQQLDAQWIDDGNSQHWALLDPLTLVDITLDDYSRKRAAHRTQRQLRVGHPALLRPYALLAVGLVEFLPRQFGLSTRLLQRLRGQKVLRNQSLGAARFVFRQLQAGFRGEHVGVDPRPDVGYTRIRTLHIGTQYQQGLAGLDQIAAFHMKPFHHSYDLRADIGDPIRFYQASDGFGWRWRDPGSRRCGEGRLPRYQAYCRKGRNCRSQRLPWCAARLRPSRRANVRNQLLTMSLHICKGKPHLAYAKPQKAG